MKTGRMLKRRNIYERQALACLRGDGIHMLKDASAGRRAFAELAGIARNHGLTIFPPTALFISDGEIAMLANLAAAQRRVGRTMVTLDDRAFETLLRCARLLRESGICLPMAALQNCPPNGKPQEEAGRPVTGMIRARALSFVRSREVASTDEFASIGVSRQNVSRMCKDGIIQRVRHGWYRAAPLPPRSQSRTYLHA